MKSSYLFENLEARQREAAFLAERAQLRMEGFSALLERHGFPPAGRILELGCGQGLRTLRMAELYPRAEVIGIDRSSELLESASTASSGRASFLEADLYELPFADESFDFVYSRLVFMHLSDPLRALRSIRRVLRPGGKVLIEDADRDCMFFEPAPQSFGPFWAKIQEAQRRHGGDPNVGRKLAPYLKEVGFLDVTIETQPIIGSGEEIGFLARTLMPSLNLYLEPRDRPQGEVAILDLERLASSDPRATFYHFWFAVSGMRPDQATSL